MSDLARRVTVQQQRKWLQESLMAAVTPEDMQIVIMMLIDRARGGSIAAAKELLDRTLGRPTQEIIVEQQEQKDPDEVRARLAALLLKHPELQEVLSKAGEERQIESSVPENEFKEEVKSNKITEKPEAYESDT